MKSENPLLAYFVTVQGSLLPVRIVSIDDKNVTVKISGTKSAQGHDIRPYQRGETIETSGNWLKSRNLRWSSGFAYTIPADLNTARTRI